MVVGGVGGGWCLYSFRCRVAEFLELVPQVQDFRAGMTIESPSRHAKHIIGHICIHFPWFVKIENFVFIFGWSLSRHVNCSMR